MYIQNLKAALSMLVLAGTASSAIARDSFAAAISGNPVGLENFETPPLGSSNNSSIALSFAGTSVTATLSSSTKEALIYTLNNAAAVRPNEAQTTSQTVDTGSSANSRVTIGPAAEREPARPPDLLKPQSGQPTAVSQSKLSRRIRSRDSVSDLPITQDQLESALETLYLTSRDIKKNPYLKGTTYVKSYDDIVRYSASDWKTSIGFRQAGSSETKRNEVSFKFTDNKLICMGFLDDPCEPAYYTVRDYELAMLELDKHRRSMIPTGLSLSANDNSCLHKSTERKYESRRGECRRRVVSLACDEYYSIDTSYDENWVTNRCARRIRFNAVCEGDTAQPDVFQFSLTSGESGLYFQGPDPPKCTFQQVNDK